VQEFCRYFIRFGEIPAKHLHACSSRLFSIYPAVWQLLNCEAAPYPIPVCEAVCQFILLTSVFPWNMIFYIRRVYKLSHCTARPVQEWRQCKEKKHLHTERTAKFAQWCSLLVLSGFLMSCREWQHGGYYEFYAFACTYGIQFAGRIG
jgi:hypothetical protein